MLWDQDHVDSRVKKFIATEVEDFRQQLLDFAASVERDELPEDEAKLGQLGELMQRSVDACAAFERTVKDEAEVLLQAQTQFRRATADLLQQSWIVQRAQEKPTGFPGDCQMLNTVYNYSTETKGLGGYIDALLLQLPLGNGVRERIRVAREFLVDEVTRRSGDVSVLDIASGPCREFENWDHRPQNGQLSVTCLDNDPQALEYVDQQVRPTATGVDSMRLERYNAIRTKSAGGNIKRFGRPNILYSVGLLDYLPDDLLLDMLAGWRQTVSDDGVVYVAFKDCDYYDHTPYQWHLDWHFLQRTEEQFRLLLAAAGFAPERTLMLRDRSKMILHFFCYMQEVPQLRFDVGGKRLQVPATSRVSQATAAI